MLMFLVQTHMLICPVQTYVNITITDAYESNKTSAISNPYINKQLWHSHEVDMMFYGAKKIHIG